MRPCIVCYAIFILLPTLNTLRLSAFQCSLGTSYERLVVKEFFSRAKGHCCGIRSSLQTTQNVKFMDMAYRHDKPVFPDSLCGENSADLVFGGNAINVRAADGHDIRVWSKEPEDTLDTSCTIVLLHGRTWSAIPVWDLQVGDPARDGASLHGASVMDLMASVGISTYAIDFRGMGATERDCSGWTRPSQCVEDVKAVLELLALRGVVRPVLLGWSQGALIAQMFAERYPECISALVLYGSIYDPDAKTAASVPDPEKPPVIMNTMEGAMEDWTVAGLIDDEAANAFGVEALKWNPRKVSWTDVHEMAASDPGRITTPTLVLFGEKDGYTTLERQTALHDRLASGRKRLRIVGGADHPVHLYPLPRRAWLRSLIDFVRPILPRPGPGTRPGAEEA